MILMSITDPPLIPGCQLMCSHSSTGSDVSGEETDDTHRLTGTLPVCHSPCLAPHSSSPSCAGIPRTQSYRFLEANAEAPAVHHRYFQNISGRSGYQDDRNRKQTPSFTGCSKAGASHGRQTVFCVTHFCNEIHV